MEYQPRFTSRSPTATHESSPFMPELEYPSLPPDLVSGLNHYMNFHGHGQATSIPADSSIPSLENTPTVSRAPSVSSTTRDTTEPKAVRRRAQNREAQRRFRERKEHQSKLLQKDAEELHKDHQTLLKQYSDTVSDLTQLVKENETLRVEVRKLRQQWRLLLAVLRLFQGSQLPGDWAESAIPFDDLRVYVEDLVDGIYPSTMRCLS